MSDDLLKELESAALAYGAACAALKDEQRRVVRCHARKYGKDAPGALTTNVARERTVPFFEARDAADTVMAQAALTLYKSRNPRKRARKAKP